MDGFCCCIAFYRLVVTASVLYKVSTFSQDQPSVKQDVIILLTRVRSEGNMKVTNYIQQAPSLPILIAYFHMSRL